MNTPITFRPGTLDDGFATFEIFQQAILDLGRRTGTMAVSGGDDPEVLAQLWERRQPMFEHLARTAEQFWLAEQDGAPVGYARSVRRGGLYELTELFVLPSCQSGGVGRGLLERAFPAHAAAQRAIVATSDVRALALYLKAGVYPRFPSCYFSRPAERLPVSTDLIFEPLESLEPLTARPEALDDLRALDLALLGHARDVDHLWLLADRRGFLYRRDGRAVGYGYVGFAGELGSGLNSGPFALLDARDFPAVLAHAEGQAAAVDGALGVEVPLINRAAVDYLLSRGYRMENFLTLFMSDVPFGQWENYIFPSPPFFL